MTDDDLDLLASAFLDGEATSEEVAMVERDPELLARVEQLRAISGRLGASVSPPPAALKEQHLAAALAEFDNPTAAAPTVKVAPGEVVDMTDRVRNADRPTSLDGRRAAKAKRRSIPQWLPAAAAFLLIGGGVVWLAGQTGSDDMDAATEALDTAAGSDESSDFATEESQRAESESSAAGETMAADESAEDAMEESSEESDDEAMEMVEEEAAESQPATTTAGAADGGFFPQEPVKSFAAMPDGDSILSDMPSPRPDLTQSNCGLDYQPPDGSEILGFLPIEIGGAPAELLILVDENGEETAVVLDDTCGQLLP